jgi:3-hydroxyisobutyrate dehydrogenase-like beta-hydroxyacid dehydrogenase
VPDGAATRAIVEEIVAAADRRVTTVVDLSTVGPQIAGEVAEQLAALGVTYTDGPVSGGVAGARAGTISMMFAGPAEALAANRPVLEAISGNVFHVGTRAGQGQAMKLLNNYLSATALAATSEAIAFGVAEGLDMSIMLDVLNVSTGRNSASADKFPNRIMTGSYDAGFHTRLMAKDVRLFLDSVARNGTAATVAESVSEVWQGADAALPGSDFTQIWQFVSGR